MNSKKIIAFGVGAVSVAALTFTTVSPASAVVVAPSTLTETVCAALPASVTSLLAQVLGGNTAATNAGTALATAQTTLAGTITQLIPAVIAHISAVSAGLPSAGTAGVLTDKANAFATAVVTENNAMTTSFDAQRAAYITGLNSTYVSGVTNGLCI
jgi:hypothetical protein